MLGGKIATHRDDENQRGEAHEYLHHPLEEHIDHATKIARDGPYNDSDQNVDPDRDESHRQRDTRAMNHPCQHVAARVVGPQPVPRAGRVKNLVQIDLGRRIGYDGKESPNRIGIGISKFEKVGPDKFRIIEHRREIPLPILLQRDGLVVGQYRGEDGNGEKQHDDRQCDDGYFPSLELPPNQPPEGLFLHRSSNEILGSIST